MSERIDISKDMTDEFYKNAKFGQLLRFQEEDGIINEFKIVRLNKKSKICIVKRCKTYTAEEFEKLMQKRSEK